MRSHFFAVSKKTLFSTILSVGTILFSQTALADPVVDAMNRMMGGYGINMVTARSPGPNSWIYPLGWTTGDFSALAEGEALGTIVPLAQTAITPPNPQGGPTKPDVAMTPTPNPVQQSIINALLTTDPSSMLKFMGTSNAIPGPQVTPPISPFGMAPRTAQFTPASTANFDLNSLINPSIYTDNGQAADNFIRFASGMATPISVLALNKNNDPDGITSKAGYPLYMATLRSYAAMQAIGVGNLYHIYAERMPLNQSGNDPALIDPALRGLGYGAIAQLPANSPTFPSASEIEIDQHSATRRLSDPSWRAGVQSATPMVLMREQLYLMAEIRYEMYKNRLELERLLATISAIQLQSLNGTVQQHLTQMKNDLTQTSIPGGSPTAITAATGR